MQPDRFEALDSWRGICACMVALYHFRIYSHVSAMPLVENSFLFVDFFFVLSGFVIAANYRSRLANGFGVSRFMTLRFGRVYFLHLAMFAAFVPIEVAIGGLGSDFGAAVLANLTLIHGLGVEDRLWFNHPSWSISSEFATYAIFAFAVSRVGGRALPLLLAAAVVACPIILALFSPRGMNATYDYGLARCLYGFAVGVACFEFRGRWPAALSGRRSSVIEAAAVLAAMAFVAALGGVRLAAIAAPFVFAVIVLVFAHEAGAISRVLKLRPLLFVGALSYSIYMTHALIDLLARHGSMALEQYIGADLFQAYTAIRDGETIELLAAGNSPWFGDLLQAVMLASTIAFSVLTYRCI